MIIKITCIVIMSLIALLTNSNTEAASTATDEAVKKLVEEIKHVIEGRQQSLEIIVGNIQAPPRMQDLSNAGFKQMIVHEMQNQKFVLKSPSEKAAFQLSATFSVMTALKTGILQDLAAVKIKATLMDSNDQEIQEFSITVTGNDLLPFVPSSREFIPEIKEQERQEFIQNSMLGNLKNDSQKVFTSSSTQEVRTSKDNPYGVKVHVLKEGHNLLAKKTIDPENCVAVVPRILNGNAHLDLPERHYILELINNSEYEAAAEVFIDTINMFAFSEDGRKSGLIIIPAHASVFVKGWYKNQQESNSFIIGNYAESAAGKLHIPDFKVGNIKVIFSACWEKTPPPDEIISKTRGPKKNQSVGTKIGETISTPYKEVNRQVGKPRALININYDLPEHLQLNPNYFGTNTGGIGNGGGMGINYGNGAGNSGN